MTSDLVSIVVAAYNAEDTIAETVRSLLSQTYKNIEIIVCDDASGDNTKEAVRSFLDQRLILLTNKFNLGPGKTRDIAISRARGRWVAIVDADDVCDPRRIETLVEAAEDGALVVLFDNQVECHHTEQGLVPWRSVYKRGSFGSNLKSWVDVPTEDWLLSSRRLMHPMFPAALIRDHGIMHSDRRFAEDSEFLLKVLSKGAKLRYLPRALYYYRISPGSLTASPSRWDSVYEIFDAAKAWFPHEPRTQAALARAASDARGLAEYHRLIKEFRIGRFSDALRRLFLHPTLAVMLSRRVLTDARYHAHRLLRRGLGRH